MVKMSITLEQPIVVRGRFKVPPEIAEYKTQRESELENLLESFSRNPWVKNVTISPETYKEILDSYFTILKLTKTNEAGLVGVFDYSDALLYVSTSIPNDTFIVEADIEILVKGFPKDLKNRIADVYLEKRAADLIPSALSLSQDLYQIFQGLLCQTDIDWSKDGTVGKMWGMDIVLDPTLDSNTFKLITHPTVIG